MDKETYEYLPAPALPGDFEKRLEAIAGKCPLGVPGIRFVWGMDRKQFYGGIEDQKYLDPNGKYIGLPYFIAEVWSPETVYDRAEWEASRYGMLIDDYEFDAATGRMIQKYDATIDVLGPFPEQGVWDYLRTCRREDFSPLTFDEMLDVAREWKQNNTRPRAAQRAIESYMRFNDQRNAMKKAAFEEAKGRHREFLAREWAKPDTKPVNNFDTKGNVPKAKRLAGGKAQTAAGLIVPASAIDH